MLEFRYKKVTHRKIEFHKLEVIQSPLEFRIDGVIQMYAEFHAIEVVH